MKILIFGLSGSGKTVLAKALEKKLEYCFHLNADEVREKYNDWDFSPEGRIRQAKRMSSLADELLKELDYVICDFICPTNETRKLVRPDYIIYMNTINKSIFECIYIYFRCKRKIKSQKNVEIITTFIIFNKIIFSCEN